MIINPGQSITFNVAFRAVAAIGLQPADIHLSTNDPLNPIYHVHVVGTGLPASGSALNVARRYVAVQSLGTPNATVLRQRADATGDWEFFLPASQPIHTVIFDPISGLISSSYDTTAPSGQITQLEMPFFEPSTASDTNGDGLPDDIKFALGTSLIKSDSNGDGIDDFTSVQQGINPLSGVARPHRCGGQCGDAQRTGTSDRRCRFDHQSRHAHRIRRDRFCRTGDCRRLQVHQAGGDRPVGVPGFASGVAVDTNVQVVAVADGSSGLYLVDISNPLVPTVKELRRHQRHTGAGGRRHRLHHSRRHAPVV